MSELTSHNAARWPFILALAATGSGTGYYAHEQVVDHLNERISDVRNDARDRYEDLMRTCRPIATLAKEISNGN